MIEPTVVYHGQQQGDDEYSLAVYSGDGMFHGIRAWKINELSHELTTMMSEILLKNGDNFRIALDGQFFQTEIQFTSLTEAAIVSIYIESKIVVTGVFVCGTNPDLDRELIKMFYDSSVRTKFLSTFIEGARFEKMMELHARPLAVLVVWANPEVSDNDIEMAQRLFWHLAGAFFNAPYR